MPGRWSEGFCIVAAALGGDHLIVALAADDSSEEAEDLTIFATRKGDGEWSVLESPHQWSVVDAVCHGTDRLLAVFLGSYGEVLRSDGAKVDEEMIVAPGIEPPEFRGPMRGLAVIDGALYAVGMGRQVYRRMNDGRWSCIDQTIRPSDESQEVVGLNAIGGYSHDDIYTAGFGGEIWRWDGQRWLSLDSPTNMPLCCVHCDEDGHVYLCGRDGVLLRGRAETWEVITDDELDDDLWSIVRYHDQVYILGTLGLYMLQGDAVSPVAIAGESLGMGHQLLVGNNRLWLIGPKDLLTFDGRLWDRVD